MLKLMDLDGDKIILSDDVGALYDFSNKGYPVVLLLTEDNRNEDTSFIRFATEDDEPCEEYLRVVLARHKKQPLTILETERLIIREFTPGDLEALVRIYEDSEGFLDPFYLNKDEASVYLEDYISSVYDLLGYGLWAVTLRTDHKLIGICGFSPRDEGAELGYGILKEYRNMGYATEAARAVIGYGQKTLGIGNISVTCDPSNDAGLKLAKKLSKTESITVNNK